MATAETARLIASLELQDKNFTRGLSKIDKGITRVDKKLGAFSGFVNRNMARAIDSIGVRLVSSVGVGLEEMATLEDAATSVTGAIGQVGKGWKLTADDVVAAANRIESETDAAFDDKAIVAASETLIRYGKVSENNLVPAMEVMTDLAARTGDVDSAATLLAKALADPAKAAGKLARAGVVLTKGQQKQIIAMVKAGKTAEAQTFLLEQLGKTTKGAAEASAGPYRDALNKLGDAGEDLRRGFVTGLAPAILEVSDLLTDELAKPETMETLKAVGKELGSALKGLIKIVKSLPWATIGESLRIAGTGAKALVDAFLGMPPWVQAAVISGWGLNKLTGGAVSGLIGNLASGLIKGVLGITAGTVIVNGPVAGGGGAAGAAGGSKLMNAVRILGAVSIAGASLIALAEVFKGFQETVTASQQDLLEKVNATSEQGFKETIANLEATNAGIKNMNPLENVLAGIFGGSEIVKNFEMATARIDEAFQAGELSRDEMITAIGALSKTLQTNPEIDLPETESLLKQLIAAVNKNPMGPDRPEKRPRVSGVGDRPSPGNPGLFKKNLDKIGFDKWVTKAGEIKNAVTTVGSDQKAELGNIKNATATLDSNTKAGLSNVKNATNTQGSLQAGRDAVNTTVTAVGALNTAAATRGVAPPIVGTLAVGFASLAATIWAARPVIQPTTIIEKQTVTERGGATSDSRTRHG